VPNGSWCERHFEMVAENEGYQIVKNGWPDYVLVKGDEIIFVEVKTKGDMLRPVQVGMLLLLERAGAKVRVAVNGELSNLVTVMEYLKIYDDLGPHQRELSRVRGVRDAEEKVTGRTQ
jgi:hypothetical protein